MADENLTPEEVTDLCTAGEGAWRSAGASARAASFKWRGRSYVAKRSQFRLMVDTPKGEPVACKWD